MKKFIPGLAAFASLIAASAANAHDFFLMPDDFRTASGPVRIYATVGSNFPKAENTVAADRVDQMIALGAGSPEVRIVGATATALDVEVTSARPGMLLTAVRTKPRDVDYAEDRIPLILGEYRVRPEAAAAVEKLIRPRNWQVSSRRYAKTLVCVRTCANHRVSARSTGAPLEFVSRNAAFDHFRLLANGTALANYPVDIVGQDGKRLHLSTDARGEIRLSASARGTMMLFAAKLKPPAKAERFILDLTSLTFSRP